LLISSFILTILFINILSIKLAFFASHAPEDRRTKYGKKLWEIPKLEEKMVG